MAKTKFYVVWEGHTPGIYFSWPDCQKQTKNFPNAKFKAYASLKEAEKAYAVSPFAAFKAAKKVSEGGLVSLETKNKEVNWNSISVDAACAGNPGVMEYQGVDTKSGARIFHQGPFPLGTNNVGEFLGLVHALALLKLENRTDMVIYTDSKTAMAWVRNKKVKTTLVRNDKSEDLWKMVDRALIWLHNNTYDTKILKWETEKWGEVPADFGRK